MLILLPSATCQLSADEPEEETWWWDHTESSYQAFMEAPDGTSDVPAGGTRNVKVTAQVTTWEVWASNYGHTENRNSTTVPFVGAYVEFLSLG